LAKKPQYFIKISESW